MECFQSLDFWRSMFVIAVFVACAWHWSLQRKADNDRRASGQNDADEEQDDVAKLALIRSQDRLIEDPQNAARAKHWYGNDKWKELREWLTFAGVMGAAIIYFRQMKANEGQADASQKQLIETRTAAIDDERAWIGTSKPILFSNRFELVVRNTGKTPALNISDVMGGGYQWNTNDIIKNIDHAVPEPRSMLFPGEEEALKLDGSSTNTYDCYFLGKIWYDDIYHHHHWTRFGYRFDGTDWSPTDINNSCDDATNGSAF